MPGDPFSLDHVLESILGHLPAKDLLLSASRVSKRWNETVSRENFLHHKKTYARYLRTKRKDGGKSDLEVQFDLELSQEREQLSETTFLLTTSRLPCAIPWLVKKVSAEHHKSEKRNAFVKIRQHSKYHLASSLSICEDDASAVALLCFLSNSLDDYREILWCIQGQGNDVDPLAGSELVEHLSTLMLYLERRHGAPTKPHYLLRHAVELSERRIVSLAEEGPSLTAEQMSIVNCSIDISSKKAFKVVAYAGTGKTTTLEHLCRNNPSLRFMLIVFNKSVERHSASVFPSNVECRTASSLAWNYCVNILGYKAHGIQANIGYGQIMTSGYIASRPTVNYYSQAAQVLDTIRSFCRSTDQQINIGHVPTHWSVQRSHVYVLEPIASSERNSLLREARYVWDLGIIKKTIKMDHNAALKIMQLDKRGLQCVSREGPFDVLLIDEAQDLNPAMLDVCLSEPVPKFIVGDPCQQIYGFNGAINGLARVEEYAEVERTFYLTKSFRFGPEIAFAATTSIRYLQEEPVKSVWSTGNVSDSIRGQSQLQPSDRGMKTAILGRSNSRIFQELVDVVCKRTPGQTPHIAIMMSDCYFEKIMNLYQLFKKEQEMTQKGQDSGKGTFSREEQNALRIQDNEKLSMIEIVKKHRHGIPNYIRTLKKMLVESDRAEYVFSTVHKFKGLECDRVILLDDFYLGQLPHSGAPARDARGNATDEYNILYVGMTRARRELVMNDSLYFLMMGQAKETFETLVDAKSFLAEEPNSVCGTCESPLATDDTPIMMFQESVVLSTNKQLLPGPVCKKCSSKAFLLIERSMSERQSELSNQVDLQNKRALLLRDLICSSKGQVGNVEVDETVEPWRRRKVAAVTCKEEVNALSGIEEEMFKDWDVEDDEPDPFEGEDDIDKDLLELLDKQLPTSDDAPRSSDDDFPEDEAFNAIAYSL